MRQGLVDWLRAKSGDTAAVARDLPLYCDVIWRPDFCRVPAGGSAGLTDGRARIDAECSLFTDCPKADIAIEPASGATGIVIAVGAFEGSFLSLSVGLPAAHLSGHSPRRVLSLAMVVGADEPAPPLARLNQRYGAATTTVLDPMRPDGAGLLAEFETSELGPTEGAPDALWIDVFFHAPAGRRIEVRDLIVARRHMAEV